MKTIVTTAILAAAALGCSTGVRIDPALERVAFTTDHFDVAATGIDDDSARTVARHADELWRFYAAELDTTPLRALLVLVEGHGDGFYLPGRPARIVVPIEAGANVLRHELAHHFAVALIGPQADWINEGVAEYLEQIRTIEGRTYVSGLAPHHLERVLRGERGGHGHAHVDYSQAWWDVARILESGHGALRDRILALPSRDRVTTASIPDRWHRELETLLVAGPSAPQRAQAAGALGLLGRRDALGEAFETEPVLPVRVLIAAELARHGDKGALRGLLAEIECRHGLDIVSRSAGRGFDSVGELDAWLSR